MGACGFCGSTMLGMSVEPGGTTVTSSGFEHPDGTWVNVLEDGTTFTDREAWMHVPDLVARARTAATARLAAEDIRRVLVDSWCAPLLDWLERRLN